MNQLVVHIGVHPLVRRERFVRVVRGSEVEGHAVVRNGAGAGVTAVGEVDEQEIDLVLGIKPEDPALEGHRVQEGFAEVGDQERLGPARVDDSEFFRLEGLELRGRRVSSDQESEGQ